MARVMVIASYAPSLINFRGDLMRAFRERGHDVVACSPDPDPATVAALTAMGVRHRPFRLQRAGLNPLQDLATYGDLKRIIREERPDHVLAYTIKPVVWGCLAAAAAKVPHIFAMITGLGTAFQGGGPRGRVLTAIASVLYRRALAGCQRVIFQNPDDRELFVSNNLVDPAKCMMTNGSGINLDRFPKVETPSGAPVFLLIARIIAEKGVRWFARASEELRRDHPEARFRLVGFFEDHPLAIQPPEVAGWVEKGLLEFPGALDDVRPELAACSVFVLPTLYREGLPRTILEALATGRAVVTTDRPGCRETVLEGQNGFLIDPDRLDDLAGVLRRYCQDPDLAPRQGDVSRRLAEEKFDVHGVNAAIIAGMEL